MSAALWPLACSPRLPPPDEDCRDRACEATHANAALQSAGALRASCAFGTDDESATVLGLLSILKIHVEARAPAVAGRDRRGGGGVRPGLAPFLCTCAATGMDLDLRGWVPAGWVSSC
mmetsp:Transcript_58212/g.175990  ORF Transcript_58212/g.175990 Transcript_58212/m.175990 type:complete len:118 (-) Transcript_58212:12-365(-)